jgi:HK97 family phage portal protein
MNLFGFRINISRTGNSHSHVAQYEPHARKSISVPPEAWLRGEDLDNRGSALSSAYEQVVWVYRAINVLAEQVANVPFVFSAGERGRENLITSGPLLDFYARPHPQINRFQYWELRVIWLMLRGECFRAPVFENGRTAAFKNQNSRIKSILLLDPSRFQHIIEDHQLIGWRYTGMGPRAPLASQVFLPEEVWFEKLPNPFDFWRGLSPLQVAGLAARTDFAAGAFMRGIIENNADTGVIVRSNEWLSDEQREQIIAALRDRKRRAGQADRPVLLLGSAEVIRPQLSSSDLQFLENRKFSRSEICSAFGVPEEIVTTTDAAKYDVMAGARLNFIENRVAPLCSRLEAEEEVTVKSIDPRASGWFDLDSLPIMQEARRSRLASARSGFEMGVPFNELNRVLDLGFKPLPWGDRGYVASKLAEVSGPGSRVSSLKSQVAGKVQSAQSSVHGLESTGVLEGQPLLGNRERQDEGPLERAATWLSELSTLNQQPSTTSQLRSRLRRFFFEQRGRALARLAAATNLPAPAPGGQEAVVELPEPLELPAENARLAALIQSAATGVSEAVLAEVNEATQAELWQALQEGRSRGETAEQLAARVRSVFNDAARRVDEIALALNRSAGTLSSEL